MKRWYVHAKVNCTCRGELQKKVNYKSKLDLYTKIVSVNFNCKRKDELLKWRWVVHVQGVKKLMSSSITSHIICRLLGTKESFQLLVGKP